MMAAVARDDDEYDLEDDEKYAEEDSQNELEKQRRILAAVANAARNQGLDLDDMEDSEDIMRRIYEENLYFQQNQKLQDAQSQRMDFALKQDQMMKQAEALASNSGLDLVEALKLIKEQKKQAQIGQLLNPPMNCMTGQLPLGQGDDSMADDFMNGQPIGLGDAGIDLNQMNFGEEQAHNDQLIIQQNQLKQQQQAQ